MNDRANFNLDDAGRQARDVDASSTPRAVARGLGWFSITLGLAELLAPRAISGAAGLDSSPALVRLYGLRELVCGIGILASDKVAPFLWARVGGDVLDIGTIVAHSNTVDRQDRTRAFGAVVNVLGVTALDVYAARGIRELPTNGVTPSMRDYSSRTGFPRPVDAMRGVARTDFEAPRDTRTPDALRAWTLPKRTGE
jgi:hypothetical protein